MNGNEVSEKFGLISRVNSCIRIRLRLIPLIPLNFITSSEVNFGLVWGRFQLAWEICQVTGDRLPGKSLVKRSEVPSIS